MSNDFMTYKYHCIRDDLQKRLSIEDAVNALNEDASTASTYVIVNIATDKYGARIATVMEYFDAPIYKASVLAAHEARLKDIKSRLAKRSTSTIADGDPVRAQRLQDFQS